MIDLESYSIPYSYDEIATEGVIADFINNVFPIGHINEVQKQETISSYKSMIMEPSNLFGKKPETAPVTFTLKPIIIDEKLGIISIQHINFPLLFTRIKESYGEKKLDAIFYRTYSNKDIKRFNRKKVTRSQMDVTSLVSPIFFALELSILFSQLYNKYRTPVYKSIYTYLYKNTWIGRADEASYSRPDVQYAQGILNLKFELKPHQIEFINAYPKWKAKLNLRGIYLAFDQGLGKTLTSLSLAMALHAAKIYIVCPNTLVANWINEINKYYDGRIKAVDCKSSNAPNDAKVFITNNESIKNILPYLDPKVKTMLIVDEGHNFRNIKSARVQELLAVREKLRPADVLMMSGTPLKATPNELVPALRMLDPTFTPEAAEMYNRCFNFDNYAAMEIVTSRLGKMIYRKMKNDVLQLPEKHIEDLKVTIRNPQPYLMSSIRDKVNAEIQDISVDVIRQNRDIIDQFELLVNTYSTAGAYTTHWYLNKVFSAANPRNDFTVEHLHELDTDKVYTFLDTYIISNPRFPKDQEKLIKSYETKLMHYDRVVKGRAIGRVYPPMRTALYNALWDENEELFFSMIRNNVKKTVIFTQFFGVAAHIKQRLEYMGIGVVSVNGTVSTQARVTALNQFQNNEDIKVIIATSQSMGTGVTLIEASQMFFFGPPWRSTDFDQCCDRIYRIGQDTDVYIYNVSLDTPELNLSSRMDAILKWSSEMFHTAIDETIVTDS